MTCTRPRPSLPTLVLLLLVLVAGWGLASAPAASAHSSLVSTTPADGSTVQTVPATVVLTFNEDVKSQFSKVLVTGPDGQQRPVTVTGSGPEVRAAVPQGLGAGAYRVVYSVVSADTHRISGQVRFTVAGASTSSTAATPTTSGSATAGSSGAAGSSPSTTVAPTTSHQADSGGSIPWGWIFPLLSLLLLVPVVWAARREVRRREARRQDRVLSRHDAEQAVHEERRRRDPWSDV